MEARLWSRAYSCLQTPRCGSLFRRTGDLFFLIVPFLLGLGQGASSLCWGMAYLEVPFERLSSTSHEIRDSRIARRRVREDGEVLEAVLRRRPKGRAVRLGVGREFELTAASTALERWQ